MDLNKNPFAVSGVFNTVCDDIDFVREEMEEVERALGNYVYG